MWLILLDVVQVICTETSMTARIQKELVENAEYSMEDLHLNDDTCTFDVDDGEFFEREISPITSCGTSYTVRKKFRGYFVCLFIHLPIFAYLDMQRFSVFL